MDGKKYFHEACRQHGIDCDTYFKVDAQNRVEADDMCIDVRSPTASRRRFSL